MKKRNTSFERRYLATVNKSKQSHIEDRESDENDELLSKANKPLELNRQTGVLSSPSFSISNLNTTNELNRSHSSLFSPSSSLRNSQFDESTFSTNHREPPHHQSHHQHYLTAPSSSSLRSDLSSLRSSYSNLNANLNFDAESLVNSFRRLGIESTSVISLINLRNNSYLISRNDDCIDTILLQMQPSESKPNFQKSNTQGSSTTSNSQIEIKLKHGNDTASNRRINFLNAFKNRISSIKELLIRLFLQPIESQSKKYLIWLSILSIFYIYNLFAISIRFAFEYDKIGLSNINESHSETLITAWEPNVTNHSIDFSYKFKEAFEFASSMGNFILERKLYWMIGDYLSDIFYLVDIFLIQTRIKFLKDGLWVSDLSSTSMNYFKSPKFKVFILF
jgi:hypothetical protein